MKIAVLGVGGYTGYELLRLLSKHLHVKNVDCVSSSLDGKKLNEIYPKLFTFSKFSLKILSYKLFFQKKYDVVFSALPHIVSGNYVGKIKNAELVIDLSADFRFKNILDYERIYSTKHPFPEKISQSAYGLPEWYSKEIKKSSLIAVPGCYPTCSLLALLPLTKNDIQIEKVVINALSGISGAGNKVQENFLFCSRDENANVYSSGQEHRHHGEIQKELGLTSSQITFNPHLIPIKRGMLATITVFLERKIEKNELEILFQREYEDSYFVHWLGQEKMPQISDVVGTNHCVISGKTSSSGLQLFSSLDNLMKGASGQAIQIFNIHCNFSEQSGIE